MSKKKGYTPCRTSIFPRMHAPISRLFGLRVLIIVNFFPSIFVAFIILRSDFSMPNRVTVYGGWPPCQVISQGSQAANFSVFMFRARTAKVEWSKVELQCAFLSPVGRGQIKGYERSFLDTCYSKELWHSHVSRVTMCVNDG